MDVVLYTKVIPENAGRSRQARLEAEQAAEYVSKKIGSVTVLVNLQNEDQEEEARRNFKLRME